MLFVLVGGTHDPREHSAGFGSSGTTTRAAQNRKHLRPSFHAGAGLSRRVPVRVTGGLRADRNRGGRMTTRLNLLPIDTSSRGA